MFYLSSCHTEVEKIDGLTLGGFNFSSHSGQCSDDSHISHIHPNFTSTSICHIIIHFPNHFGDGSTTHWPSCTLFVQVPEQSVETLRPLVLTALGVAETCLELMLGLIKMIGFPFTNPSYFCCDQNGIGIRFHGFVRSFWGQSCW